MGKTNYSPARMSSKPAISAPGIENILQTIEASNQAILRSYQSIGELIQSSQDMAAPAPQMNGLMTFEELGEYLKQSPKSLRTKYKQMKLPYYQLGKNIRFRQHEIDAWLETKKVNRK